MAERPGVVGSEWSDERIITALASLRDELYVSTEPLDATVVVVARDEALAGRQPSRWRRPLLAAAVIMLVVVALGAAIAPAREAVADWLGIGSTEVRVVPEGSAPDPSLPGLADGARPVDASGAAAELGRELPTLGHPHGTSPPQFAIPLEGGVLVRWDGRDETLWVRAEDDESVTNFKKLAGDGSAIEFVDGLGDRALWVGGSHVLETPGRELAAANVLLWVDDGLELRLEGDLGRDEMVAIASALH